MSNPLDITDEQARRIVLDIRRGKGFLSTEASKRQDADGLAAIQSLQKQLGDVVEKIATDIYSRQNRFILELIQNAEDCEFTRTKKNAAITFEVNPGKIVVECNEDGFTERDVLEICDTAKSWKKSRPGYIGEKGLGFKSVFQVASRVHIQSNSFSFSFEYNGEPESIKKLGIITPIPEDDIIPSRERPLTRMTLYLHDRISYDEVVSQFTTVPNTLLLFLSKIREIRIKIHFPDQRSTTTTFRKSDEGSGVIRLSKHDGELEIVDELYIVTRTTATELPYDATRIGIKECDVVLAFPVQNGRPLVYPLVSLQYDVFAFLPVCTAGFNFLIQADFILQANREGVRVDSRWNNKIIEHAAEAFCQAMLDFCRRDTLRYHWMRYLPVVSDFKSNPLWLKFASKIINLLRKENILYHHPSAFLSPTEPNKPGDLRILFEECKNKHGQPLFLNRSGETRKFLSLDYEAVDIEILRTSFEMQYISDFDMFWIIKRDLTNSASTLKNPETDADWHTRAADLIVYMMNQSPRFKRQLMDLSLIPLSDNSWVAASAGSLLFPAKTGPAIPPDVIVTIHPQAVENNSRKEMFVLLNAHDCLPNIIVDSLLTLYSDGNGASDLGTSKAHLHYLHWHANVENTMPRLWVYDHSLHKVTPYYKVIYMPSDDEYGPRKLLTGGGPDPANPSRMIPECPVRFLNDGYMELFSPSIQQHSLSWLDWLERVLQVRCVPRLKHGASSLSSEFRYIIRYRPEKTIGTLKKYWSHYRQDMTRGSQIVDEISNSEVACLHALVRLSDTYFPLPSLVQKSHELGIDTGFPFLAISEVSTEDSAYEDWVFLDRFGVKFKTGIQFYLDILRQHKGLSPPAWSMSTRSGILKTYELIADECSGQSKDMIFETFYEENLILHPTSFQSASTAATWVNAQSCVWRGPENVIDKTPLASVSLYRKRKLTQFFCDILNITNANWHDYMDMLLKFRKMQRPPPDLFDKLQQLYELLSKSRLEEQEWESVINNFETERLIYVTSATAWFAPSQCLWASPVPIEGRAIIGSLYPDTLKSFLSDRLKISPASLSTVVEELSSLSKGQPSPDKLKEMIWAVNDMDPKESDLRPIVSCDFLPIRGDRSGSDDISLQSCSSNFAITDRAKLASTFRGRIGFLDFSLEEVGQLRPFLQALNLDRKYLSVICTENTACNEDRVLDRKLTKEFQDRAYYLLRCAVSSRSPLAIRAPSYLYNGLLQTTVFTSDGISTQCTIQQQDGDMIGPIEQETGHLHIEKHDETWQIYVPRNRHVREVCYRSALPDALIKIFEVSQASRESVGHVLNSSILVLDDILERAGIGRVPGIAPPPRASEDISQGELDSEESATVEGESPLSDASHLFPSASEGSEASLRPSERLDTPSSSTLEEEEGRAQGSTYSYNVPPRSSLPVDLRQIPSIPSYRSSAYRDLLDNVIRIARRTQLPLFAALPSPGNGQWHVGFDHEAAFGIRSQGETKHGIKIGAAGELFIYEILSNMALTSFGHRAWRSKIRNEVTIHPKYADMRAWTGTETSDLVYKDNDSSLTRFLIVGGYLDAGIWAGAKPEYYIEVKATMGEYNTQFFMNRKQYKMMGDMALREQVSEKIYMICRVYNLGKETLDVKIYVDPYVHIGRSLEFEEDGWTVKPI